MIQCDVDINGTDFFNLTAIKDNIIEADLINSIRFYKNEEYATDGINEISNPSNYENTGRNEIFVRIYNDNGCYVIQNFFIESAFVKLGNIEDFFAFSVSIDTATENMGVFNLDLKRTATRTALDLSNNDKIRFYLDALSAQLTTDELDGNFTSKSALIWVRVDTPMVCGLW
jgi:hypothetical protein